MNDDWATVAQLITAIATFALLGVWVFYAMLFYSQHRERTRPWLLLHQDGDATIDAHCLLSNMSEHTAHISAVLVVVHAGDRRYARRLRGSPWVVDQDEDDGPGQLHAFREGPLPSGSVVSLGTFRQFARSIVEAELPGEDDDSDQDASRYRQIEELELRVIAASAVDERGPLGAYRRFQFEQARDGQVMLRPVDLYTPQMRSRSEKRRLQHWLESVWEYEGRGGHWEIDD